ncbi:MAG: 50S ribosomal protein L29 [Bacilli bacterium]|nr:50S ribosomal protein L29 [Bacilli bacterium]
MKTNDIRNMTTEEMNKKIGELKIELFDLRMKQATGNLDKSHKINDLRKTIARIKTVLNEKDGSEK